MSELKFVLKSFGLAIALTMLMQVQIGQESIETKAEMWVHSSAIGRFLQGVSTGAIKAFKTGSKTVTEMISHQDIQGVSKFRINRAHTQSSANNSESEE